MTDWPVKTLGDLLEVSIGGIWGSEAGEDEVDVFVYRSTELIKDGQLKEELTVRRSITARQLDSRKLEEGDLLLEKSGGGPKTPVGRVGLVKVLSGLSVCSNFMQLMRPRNKEVLPVYLHYFLNHFHVAGHTEDLQNNSTNIRNLKTTEYMEVEVPLPPLEEQKRIVELLDAAAARVTEIAACYEQARTHANNLFTSALRELMDDLDETVVMTLADICMVDWGNTNLTKKSYLENGDYLAVSATGPDGRIGHAEHKAFTPVLSAIGARCGRMFLPEEDFTAIKNTITLTPRLEVASGKYIYFLFEHLSLPIRGAAQPFIAKGDIEKFEVAIPPLSRQEKIVSSLELLRKKTSQMVAAYDAKLTAAKNLRQSILESVFAGDL